jgi:hypothetical protein
MCSWLHLQIRLAYQKPVPQMAWADNRRAPEPNNSLERKGIYSESIQLHNPIRLCWQGAETGRRREESGGGSTSLQGVLSAGENSFTVAI